MDLSKLGRTERILAVVGLLAFIDSFLPWYTVSSWPFSASASGWGVGVGGWLAMLLLLAIGVICALPAFGRSLAVRGGYAAFGSASVFALVIVLIRWLTFPSAGDNGLDGISESAGAGFGTYVGVALCVVSTVFCYRAFTAAGGTLNNLGAAFTTKSSDEWQQTPR
jgi:hypothetical protein